MRLFIIIPALFLTLIMSCSPWLADTNQSANNLKRDIEFLASDEMMGRNTPSPQLDKAAEYLATQLQAAGWQPGEDSNFFQEYTLGTYLPADTSYSVKLNDIILDPSEYYFLGGDPAVKLNELELIFLGHGVFVPEKGVNDFGDIDISGKAVVALRGAPWELDPHVLHAPDCAAGKSVSVNVRSGSLLIYVSHEFDTYFDGSKSSEAMIWPVLASESVAYLPEFKGASTQGAGNILTISAETFDRVLAGAAGATYRQWQERLGQGEKPQIELSGTVSVEMNVNPVESKAKNVLAILPGNDPVLKNEWVVMTAHYDHVGSIPAAEGEDGIFNGADDNASGTAALLEVARNLATSKHRKRSVIILLVSGEEKALLGTAHYSYDPYIPFENVIAEINVDMVGRSSGSVQGISHNSEALFAKAVEMGKISEITVLEDQQPTWRLDYFLDTYHFARFEVPTISFFTELHEDYHQPSDEADKIHYEELGGIVKVVLDLADFYIQGGEKPDYFRPEWFLTP